MLIILERGGILMYPIMLLSVISLAIFMERLYTLRKKRYIPVVFTKNLKDLVSSGQTDEALKLCEQEDYAISRIAAQIISNCRHPWEQLVSIAEEAGKQEADRLSRFRETMVTIVAISPLMGLLGTVFGMIQIFNVLSSGGVGDAQALSGGIAEALLTTAAGLCVAIPAQIFYYIIQYRSDTIVKELEKESLALTNLVSTTQKGV